MDLLPHINTEAFNYKDGTFTAMISDLDNFVPALFELISQRTDKAVTMIAVAQHNDREGDITHWEYKPRDPGESRFENLIIFND